jgi:hypothetical protein
MATLIFYYMATLSLKFLRNIDRTRIVRKWRPLGEENLVSAKAIPAINLPVTVAMDKNWKPIPSFSSTLLELFGVLQFFYPFHCPG